MKSLVMGYRNLRREICEHNTLEISIDLLQRGDTVLGVSGQKT